MPRGTPRLRRYLVWAVLCLVLGAVTTVGVAWGFTRPWGAGRADHIVAFRTSEQWWNIHCDHRLCDSRLRVYSLVRDEAIPDPPKPGPTVCFIGGFGKSGTPPSAAFREAARETARSQPYYGGLYQDLSRSPVAHVMRASWGRFPPPTAAEGTWTTTIAAGYPFRALRGSWNEAEKSTPGCITLGGRRRPWHPIWSGFLLDTFCYAAAWGIAIFFVSGGVGGVRAARRRRRGQCAKCGYDLTGISSVCPECGTAPSAHEAPE